MKKNLLFIALTVVTVALFSCKKTDTRPDGSSDQPSANKQQPGGYAVIIKSDEDGNPAGRVDNCIPTEVTLIAGQTMNSGSVSVSNDDNFIYVTYTTAPGWYLTQTHLYVGDCALIPVNNPGNPIPGQFPYGGNHSNATTVTYEVPISAIPMGGCGCIAAHAVVKQLNASGQTIQTQTGWGQGTQINLNGGNWGMKFDYCSCSL